MRDTGLLLLRCVAGGLVVAHGAQKLLGSSGGHGLDGTAGWMESLGLRPGKVWALGSAVQEIGGGALTVLGLLNPLGPLGIAGAMGMAIGKVHWGKPVWVTAGGAELAVLDIAIASSLALTGPGKYSLDAKLGLRLPGWVPAVGTLATAAAIGYGLYISRDASQPASQSLEYSEWAATLVTGDQATSLPIGVPSDVSPKPDGLRIASRRNPPVADGREP